MNIFIRFFHNFLWWGFPKERNGGDGFQPTYSCKYCEDSLAQDSTGAWFHLEYPTQKIKKLYEDKRIENNKI